LFKEKAGFYILRWNQFSAFAFVFFFQITADSTWFYKLLVIIWQEEKTFIRTVFTNRRVWNRLHRQVQERDRKVAFLPNICATENQNRGKNNLVIFSYFVFTFHNVNLFEFIL
jgi:hypothetical protein